MSKQLESALVITLRNTIPWQSALEASTAGTLSPVDPSINLDPSSYQKRDRELAFRDMAITSALIDATVEISDVWQYLPDMPRLQGPVSSTFPVVTSEITTTGTNLSFLRHVKNSSIPYDAVRYADADLYGRDALVYEILARACETFTDPPIPRIDYAGTLVSSSGSSSWSLGEGLDEAADISSALKLDKDLFKLPDQNLADRDNQMAGYVAHLAQVLKNPFEYALRLYVEVTGSHSQEPETYTLISDDGVERVWQGEPALSNRHRIIYNISNKTIQWLRQYTDEVHVPQIYALSIPGIEPTQILSTLPKVPDQQDCDYWRHKAGYFVPEGEQISDKDEATDTYSYLTFTANDNVTGGVMQVDSASLTVPGSTLTCIFPGTLSVGKHRLCLLAEPNSTVEIGGNQNISDTSGTLGGATYEIDSGSIASGATYLVEGGDGITYAGQNYYSGDIVYSTSGSTAFTQINAGYPSTVRQHGLNFSLPLPEGTWRFKFSYTNLSGTNTDGFGIKAIYSASGAAPVTIMQDVSPIPFDTTNGNLLISPEVGMDVVDNNPFNLNLSWTYGDGQLHVRSLYFNTSQWSTGSYAMTASFGTYSTANVTGQDKLPEVIQFEVELTAPVIDPEISINWTESTSLPVKVKQLDIISIGTYYNTPNADLFQSFRQECLDRTEQVIQQGYNLTIAAYGTNVPEFRDSGTYWNVDSMENWMSFVEVKNPRLREVDDIASDAVTAGRHYQVDSGIVVYGSGTYSAGDAFYGVESSGTTFTGGVINQLGSFRKSRAGNVGRPALIPMGLYIDSTGTVRNSLETSQSIPVVVSCQPWMIGVGCYVAHRNFWMPCYL